MSRGELRDDRHPRRRSQIRGRRSEEIADLGATSPSGFRCRVVTRPMTSARRAPLALLLALSASPATRYEVRTERVWIPMKDGVRLAATLFVPNSKVDQFPSLLEYLPYRKDDFTSYADERHSWFAQRGYVSARVDIRGTGRSEGR